MPGPGSVKVTGAVVGGFLGGEATEAILESGGALVSDVVEAVTDYAQSVSEATAMDNTLPTPDLGQEFW